MRVTSGGGRTVRGDEQFGGHFAGDAWIDHLARPGEDTQLSVQSVYFTPGSRTAWHAHPNGQIIHVVAGEGRIQLRNGDVQALRPGTTVIAPPGEWHWHGASPDTSMTMIAVQQPDADGRLVEWGEPVEDEQ